MHVPGFVIYSIKIENQFHLGQLIGLVVQVTWASNF